MCDRALGMQSGRIKNAAITASSKWDKNHAPYLARLGRLRRGRLMGAWSAKRNNHNQFIQVDLLRSMKITGVATQGRAEAAQWVTAFYFLYSSDGVKFAKVKHWWDVVKVGISLRARTPIYKAERCLSFLFWGGGWGGTWVCHLLGCTASRGPQQEHSRYFLGY